MKWYQLVLALLLGILIGWFMCRAGCGPFHAAFQYTDPKEVHAVRDSAFAYHIPINQKTVHLSLSEHGTVAWTFDHDASVDSVIALFSGPSPFRSSHFSFADSAAFSGLPTVSAGATIYNYVVTVYPHGHAPVTADPGIIIDM
jgi:hypothetical protein